MSGAHESKAGQSRHDNHRAAQAELLFFELGDALVVFVNLTATVAADAFGQGGVLNSLLVFVDGRRFVIVRPNVLSHIFLHPCAAVPACSSNEWRIKHVVRPRDAEMVHAAVLVWCQWEQGELQGCPKVAQRNARSDPIGSRSGLPCSCPKQSFNDRPEIGAIIAVELSQRLITAYGRMKRVFVW